MDGCDRQSHASTSGPAGRRQFADDSVPGEHAPRRLRRRGVRPDAMTSDDISVSSGRRFARRSSFRSDCGSPVADTRTGQQHGPSLEMTLSGATLRSRPIPARVEPGRVVFNLGWTNESDTDERLILENFGASGFLAIGGSAVLTSSPNRVAGTLFGEV